MFKNFIILFISVFIIGLSLRIYLSTFDDGPVVAEVDIKFNLAAIDSTFFHPKTEIFEDILINYLYQLERVFLNKKTKFDSNLSRNYALGLIYFARYKELLSARDLLSEINNNLYFKPLSDKHKTKIPMLTKVIESDSDLIYNKNKYWDYQVQLRQNYGKYKLLPSNYFAMYPTEFISLKDEVQGEIIIYNPYFYNMKADYYLRKSKENFSNFLETYEMNDKFDLIASVKLGLLDMYNENIENKNIISNDLIDRAFKILNDKKNRFQLDVVDFLVLAELNNFLDINDSKKIYRKIDDRTIKVLYQMKRELYGLEKMNNRKIKNINCNELNDRYFPYELYLTESELIYKNSFLSNKNETIDYVDNADSKINDFWTKCVAVEKRSSMDCATKNCLKYNNYSSTLLKSFRLGLWHGGELPNWNGRIKRIFSRTSDSRIIDPIFDRILNQIDIWIQRII
ncbi:MAG: hypothetical protein CMD23_00640 [Flavobacteriales bacterium]|nr:hypothetical protein [Flavobacteriales bacterium]